MYEIKIITETPPPKKPHFLTDKEFHIFNSSLYFYKHLDTFGFEELHQRGLQDSFFVTSGYLPTYTFD